MNVEQGFYSKDLNVYFNRSEKLGEIHIYYDEYFMQRFKYYNNSYKIFFALDGDFTLTNGNCEKIIGENTFTFASPFDKFTFKPHFDKPFRFLFITLHPNVFSDKAIENTYFRVFENLKNEQAFLNTTDSGLALLSDI